MAQKPQTQGPVDLFGNPRVSPKQMMQRQLAELLQETATRTAGADPRTQGVSMMGTALGGVIGNLMIEKGMVPKPPEMERAEKMEKARTAIDEDAKRQGIDPTQNPSEFADMAASHFLRAGDEQSAMMAMNWKQLQEANQRVAAKDKQAIATSQAQELENLKGYTPASIQEFKQTGDYSTLVMDPEAAKQGRAGFTQLTTDQNGRIVYHDTRAKPGQPSLFYGDTGERVLGPVRKGAESPDLQGRLSASKKAGEKTGEGVVLLDGKLDAHEAVVDARALLDKGIYSGALADFRKNVGKFTPGDKTRVANTELFMAHIGNVVIPRLKEFGGNDSNEELRYLQKVMGGDTSLEEPALRKILESTERKIARGIARTRKRVKAAGLPADDNDAPSVGGVPTAPKPAAGNTNIDALLKKYGKSQSR